MRAWWRGYWGLLVYLAVLAAAVVTLIIQVHRGPRPDWHLGLVLLVSLGGIGRWAWARFRGARR